MVLWIILAYLAASCVASLVVYGACIAAARADKIQQHDFIADREPDTDDQQTARAAANRLALNA